MLSRELIDLVNSGEAVAIVGCGVSIEAGVPSWGDLFARVADAFQADGADTKAARAVAANGDLPAAFDALAKVRSRQLVHEAVRKVVAESTKPGRHHERLADWPFRFYVTTNYDHLLEKAKAASGRLVSVGNKGAELHKLAGGPRDVVWHIHGGCDLRDDVSQIVVTKSDYDDLYPASNQIDTLKAITKMHRCVYLGFGFNDKDLLHMLSAVGRLAHAGRPSFALLASDREPSALAERQAQIRADYNVEVIPYQIHGRDHSELHRRLDGHSAFILRHSVSLGTTPSRSPDYEPIAASLRVQSSLDLGELSAGQPSLRKTLVGAKMLARIRENRATEEADLIRFAQGADVPEQEARECLKILRDRGLITPGKTIDLTDEYSAKTSVARARLELSRDRFLASLRGRMVSAGATPDEAAGSSVIDLVARFMEELCRDRGLGVAQNLASTDKALAARRAVALIHGLPDRLKGCASHNDALMAINLTTDILTGPSTSEVAFLGTLCQCYFGQHLVGASDRLSKVDLDLISGTCYVLDASFIICLLAEGTEVQQFASKLVEDLKRIGAILTTTDLFAQEVVEHAYWAVKLVNRQGETSPDVLDALRGQRGYRPNQFLKGYFLGTTTDTSFGAYISRVIGRNDSAFASPENVSHTLGKLGIDVLEFSDWDKFNPLLFDQRARFQVEIEARRRERKTYKHDRQTQAEAEVAIIVDGIRRGTLQPPGGKATDAFFLSSTRVVDGLPGLEGRISLLPEGLAQWIWSRESNSERHAELVFEQLLWELTQEGVEFVDRKTLLRRFSGVFEAAKDELQSTMRDQREHLVDRYGPDPSKAFSDVDPLDLPTVAREVNQLALARMGQRVADAQKREAAALAAAKRSQKDQDELVRLRTQQQMRHKKALRNQRAAASRPGKKKVRRPK